MLVSFDNDNNERKYKGRLVLRRDRDHVENIIEYKINKQTILKEHIDEHYEPTDDEIREYASYIGIDPDKVRENKKTKVNIE